MSRIPHTVSARWPEGIPESRFAAHIRQAPSAGAKVAIIGLADDLGVRLNGGRPGAMDGPRAFREALSRYGVAKPYGWDWPVVLDAGDIVPATGGDEAALNETHRRVTEAVAVLLELGFFPIGIGGGHDLTFPLVRAVASKFPILAADYFDAHLDVRETAGSGMAFRRLIEDCGIRHLRNSYFNPLANSREHVEWFMAHGGRFEGTGEDWEETQPAPRFPEGIDYFVSIDLDCMDAAHAPGVSAPNPAGVESLHLQYVAAWAGEDPRVRCFDIMELCPPHDEGDRTARLAAHLFLSFLRGFAERRP